MNKRNARRLALKAVQPMINAFKISLAEMRDTGCSEAQVSAMLRKIEDTWTGEMPADDLAHIMKILGEAARPPAAGSAKVH